MFDYGYMEIKCIWDMITVEIQLVGDPIGVNDSGCCQQNILS